MQYYSYINGGGQEAIKNELVYKLKAYLEAKELMKSCQNLHIYIALKNLCEELRS